MAKYDTEKLAQVNQKEIIINNPFELYNDSLYFLEETRMLEDSLENRFKRWRNIRLTIVCSLMSLESYVNVFITQHSSKKINIKQIGLGEKLTKVLEGITGKRIDENNPSFQDFLNCKKIRNNLIHFDGDIDIYKEDLTLENAEKSVDMVGRIIKELHKVHGSQAPPWITMKKTRII